MKVTVTRSELKQALTAMGRLVPRNSPKPVLSSVKVTARKMAASGDRLEIVGTDLENWAIVRIAAEVEEEGSCVINCAEAKKAAGAERGGNVTIATAENWKVVMAGDAAFIMDGLPVNEYPVTPELGAPIGSFDAASDAVDMLDAVAPAITRENSRYAIQGVYLASEHGIAGVATDGYRLHIAHAHGSIDVDGEEPEGMARGYNVGIVPAVFKGLFGKCGGRIGIYRDSGKTGLWFDAQGDIRYFTREMDGHFPRYLDVIPKDSSLRVTVGAGELASRCKLAQKMVDSDRPGMAMTIDAQNIAFAVAHGSLESCPVKSHRGEAMTIGFNPAYLLDALDMFDGEVVMEYQAANRPAKIHNNNGRVAVVMPVNL